MRARKRLLTSQSGLTLLEVLAGMAIVAAVSVAALPLLVAGERATRTALGDPDWEKLQESVHQRPIEEADLEGAGIERTSLEGAPWRMDRAASEGEWTWVVVRWKDAWIARPVREAAPSEASDQGEESP
jgi:prepilin-type N-terminal cleavage/methylation domain-containing protein